MNAEGLIGYLEKIHTRGKFDYENDQVKEDIISYMRTGGHREEDYVKYFKLILARIERSAGYSKDPDRENGFQVNLTIDSIRELNMGVFFEPYKTKLSFKRYKIYKIVIVNRKALQKNISRGSARS